jgi:N-acyl-D-aspartate/D-glutamate deacylase
MAYDLIVRNALIVDGTGQKAYPGDIAVDAGCVAAVGEVTGAARRTIDAEGQAVAPGFIDPHTHYDAQLLWDPSANPSNLHGVTTILMGNCGYTLAPVRSEDQDYLMGLFSAAEEVPKSALQAQAPFQWESFADYLRWLARRAVGVNVVPQVGHSAVRRYVMGEAALERTATDDEIAGMVLRVEEALEAGAAGLSTSQASHQVGEFGEHIPSYFASDAETEALASAVRRKGKQLLTINPRTKRDGLVDEDRKFLVKLAQISGAVVSWNDFGIGTPGWHSVVDYMEAEIQRGHAIYAIARCQRAETRFTLKKLSVLFATFEPWLEYSRLDHDGKMTALRDSAWRKRLADSCNPAGFMAHASVEMGISSSTQALKGRLLGDIAQERGVSVAEAMLDIALEDSLETFFRLSRSQGDESGLERILKSPAIIAGISDGGAHLQTFSSCDYTSYFLQHWVREKGSFTLEEGVEALTSRVANFLGLNDRGTLEVGKAADMVIFDPDAVGPLPLQTPNDIPGGGTRMVKAARGIPWVIVNGEPLIENGALTDRSPGRVLGLKADVRP